jgi:hypothetical protein
VRHTSLDRVQRIRALQKRWDRLRSALDELLDKRGADMCDAPGGATGILCKDYKGQTADRLVAKIDPGVISLASELRANHQKKLNKS